MAQHEKIFPHVLSKAKMDSLRRIFSKKKSQGNFLKKRAKAMMALP
jgi:hypothetical protein